MSTNQTSIRSACCQLTPRQLDEFDHCLLLLNEICRITAKRSSSEKPLHGHGSSTAVRYDIASHFVVDDRKINSSQPAVGIILLPGYLAIDPIRFEAFVFEVRIMVIKFSPLAWHTYAATSFLASLGASCKYLLCLFHNAG